MKVDDDSRAQKKDANDRDDIDKALENSDLKKTELQGYYRDD